jgi:anaerobic selenocysteine-containing dehydrogenase
MLEARTITTARPRNCYSTCGMRVTVEDGRLRRIEAHPGNRMAWVERGNPIPQNPETPTVLRAFRALEFRVVVDELLTDTAREADLVLPAKSMFEQTDVIGAYWHDYLQLERKAIEPPGEVKPESEVYRLLAEGLGFPRDAIARDLPGPSDAEVEAFLAAKLQAVDPALTLDRLRAGPVRSPGAADVAFADLRFPTPSAKIELLSEEAARRWGVDPLPGWKEPVEWTRGGSADLAAVRVDADFYDGPEVTTPRGRMASDLAARLRRR